MSQENVEMVRRLAEAFRTGDAQAAWATARDLMDPEMEMDTTRLPAPGLADIYTGPEQIAGFWLEWLEAWGSLGEFGDFEVRDAGDQIVWWTPQHSLRGKGSGLAVDMPEYAWTAVVRDGKFVRATVFMSKTEALESAGLSE